MILLVDNNEERRKDIQVKLRIKGYTVSVSSYDELLIRTKPFFTVYINPTKNELGKIYNGDTKTIIFSNREHLNLPKWSINIDSIDDIANTTARLYNELSPFQKQDIVDIVGYACMKGRFALGGREIRFSKRENEIIRFFMNQPNKKFSSYDASSYIRILTNPEENYRKSISSINTKAKKVKREPIIIYKDDKYFFNPVISSYICQEVDEPNEYDTAENLLIIDVTNEF